MFANSFNRGFNSSTTFHRKLNIFTIKKFFSSFSSTFFVVEYSSINFIVQLNSFNRKPFNYIRNYLYNKTISYTLQYLNISNNYFSFQCTCLKLSYYFIISLSSTSKHLTKTSTFRFCQSQVNFYFFIGLEIVKISC